MASFRPVEVFALAVPPGEQAVPPLSSGNYPVTFRLTMAAIDPTIQSAEYAQVNGTPTFTGSTLRLIRIPDDDDDEDSEDDSEDEDFDLDRLIAGASSDEDDDEDDEDDEDDDDEEDEDDDEDSEDDEDDEDDEEINGGPSDPSKSPKAKREAALLKFRDALKRDGHAMDIDDDEEENDIGGNRLTAKQKGKAKITDLEDMDDSDDDDISGFREPEETVLCTLDLSRNYQQPLDITINEHETVLFQASGTHTVYLTGNILIPEDLASEGGMFDPDDEEGEYDLSPDEDKLDLVSDEDESDELDDLEDPRIEELDSDQDDLPNNAPPKLVASSKGKNKRPHDDSDDEDAVEPSSLNDTLNKSLKSASSSTADMPEVNGEQQLSKNQLKKLRKKLKDNAGNGVEPTAATEDVGVAESKTSQNPVAGTKKVQFAKTLVQGPSSSPSNGTDTGKGDTKAVNGVTHNDTKSPKPSLGVKVVQGGVTLDDKKLGSGPAAKKGDKVSMRYIGKLDKDKKVFDSNKKGKPFMFQIGAGQVIKGWDIGVQGMSVGGERRITIPPSFGYGNKAQGNDIPANSTLVFDVKLLNIA